MAKWVESIGSIRITHIFWRGGLIFSTYKKNLPRIIHGHLFFYFSFFFFYKIYLVEYLYALWTILLIMNLYFIMDMVNLWSVNILMFGFENWQVSFSVVVILI